MYDAAFCHARLYAVPNLGLVASGGAGDHGHLAAHVTDVGMARVAQRLGQLRAWRNQCDDDDVVPGLAPKVRTSRRHAADVIVRL